MVAHGRPLHLAKRQAGTDPLVIPTAAGVITDGVTSVNTAVGTATNGLAFDSSAVTSVTESAPPLAPTNTAPPTITPTVSSTSSTSSTETATPTEAAVTAASKNIALSTVIGTCVGAFIGASALIIFGVWIYRRYSRSLKKRAMSRGPLSLGRNMTADQARRRSRLEPWNKLEDGDDKWEGMYQTKERETDQVAPMEKLTMFKKTPSVRTAYTHKSTDVSAFDFPQSYADFDPKLAETLSTSSGKLPEPRPFMGRIDADPPQSWNSNGSQSYLSVRTQMSSGAMSPSLHMAIPTPPPTASQAHIWESAEVVHEVVHYSEAQSANVEHSDTLQVEDQRRSTHNPFFGARDADPRRSRSNSVSRSRSNSITTKSPTAKGKERMRYSNDPFDDINESMPRPKFVQHLATASSSSTESKEKALQSLIAALDITEDDARTRLRIASMQPSLISNVSSMGGDIEDVTRDFPLPPSRSEGSNHLP
ncbi:hypothetical protein BDN70DRAFT_679190 [Pholiota conissans]|uniref:Uncharacterized protein n=1 Tax=Pholiota conissans TaxID=109636 RepID=A0A9P5ZD07_9AGAR|nr:hypothetical protein BDN70DRAFT_679190 [Pholiota conissans]